MAKVELRTYPGRQALGGSPPVADVERDWTEDEEAACSG
jgi:hypothetical protein